MAQPHFLNAWAPRVLSILRFISGVMFMLHGTQKMFGFPDAAAGGTGAPLMSKMGIAGLIEVVMGALIAVGLLTRIASFLASGEMAVAYFTAHAPSSFWPTMNQGELPVLYCFLFFYFVFSGPGPWSLDAIFRRGAHSRS